MKSNHAVDKRLEKRLAVILESLSENPEESIPAACQGWTETKGAYRFLDNATITFETILAGHKAATLERIRHQPMVLLAQDTPFLNFAEQEAVGLGTLKRTESERYLLHPTVAFTPSRVNLGVLGAKFWQRPEEKVARLRNKKPIEEKESYRWLESYDLACEVQRQCPDTLIVSVADREGDIHEWFLDAQNRPMDEKAELLVRAKCNRRTQRSNGEYSYLWDEMAACPKLGSLKFHTPRAGNKPSRIASVDIRAKEIEFCGRQGKATEPVYVYAVYVTEKKAPKGEQPIEWMLLTSLPVQSYEVAQAVVGWYRCRWEEEIYFRVLKQGCQIERLRFENGQAIIERHCHLSHCCLAYSHDHHAQSRERPEAKCDRVFSEQEWKTIYLMNKKKKPPNKPPTQRMITRMLAQIGGFLARKGDGEPGIKNIWRGYRALKNYIDALEVAQIAL